VIDGGAEALRRLRAQGGGVRAALRRLAEGASESFVAERDRWTLWLPALLAVGIGAYFLLPVEPPLWLGAVLPAALLLAAVAVRRRPAPRLLLVALAVTGLGFGAAELRTAAVVAPILVKRFGPVEVTGRIIQADDLERGGRLLLEEVAVPGLAADRTPERVRLRVRRDLGDLRPGERVTVRAVLLPPPGPVAPGAFDFQRQAFFAGLGATGYAVAPPVRIGGGTPASRFDLWLIGLRQTVNDRIVAHIDGPAGAMASALLTGQRTAIPESDMQAMRDSGLAHLIAISGLNIGLVAAIVFFAVRAVLALADPLALRFPIKKWAAVAALFATLGYTLLAGQSAPTERSFLMTAIVLLGVMLDRTALSMRLIAWAAAVLLLFNPEYLLGVSFQLSFAATLALIAVYETLRGRLAPLRAGLGWWQRAGLYLAGVLLTSVVAGLATGPYVVFHFGRFALYGVAANMIAVPLTGFWIMPWGLLAFALMPFGLESLALVPMGWGVEGVLWTARTVAAWPGAVTLLPAMPTYGLMIVTLGGLWLALWRRRWRLAGLPVIALGLATGLLVRPADVLIAADGGLMAVRGADGSLTLSSARAGRFSAEGWLRLDGQDGGAPIWPETGVTADGRLRCDALGCIYRAAGRVVALMRRPAALAEDCGAAGVILSREPVRARCRSARLVVDRFDLWRNGSYALWLGPAGVRVEHARGVRGERPWVLDPRRPRGGDDDE
jgi:competence protein ComEC